MFTRESKEFYAKQQRFIFIRPDVYINAKTNLPNNANDYQVVDADDLVCIGVPMDVETDTEFEFWAVLEPGEILETDEV